MCRGDDLSGGQRRGANGGESMFRENDNSIPALHSDPSEDRLAGRDAQELNRSLLGGRTMRTVGFSSSIRTTNNIVGGKNEIQKSLRFALTFLLAVFSPAAFAQQTSSNAQVTEKTALVGEVNGHKEKQAGAPTDPNYVIGPQDTLDISVWKEPDLTRTVPVRPDGKISLPLLDDVQAGGLTPVQLRAQITEKLKKYLTDPQVTVVVTTIASQRVYVLGEVTRAGAYQLLSGMTVLQALSSAGGFTQFANPKNVYVLRMENGKQVKHPFNYKDVVNGKSPEQNVELKTGDTIVVP